MFLLHHRVGNAYWALDGGFTQRKSRVCSLATDSEDEADRRDLLLCVDEIFLTANYSRSNISFNAVTLISISITCVEKRSRSIGLASYHQTSPKRRS